MYGPVDVLVAHQDLPHHHRLVDETTMSSCVHVVFTSPGCERERVERRRQVGGHRGRLGGADEAEDVGLAEAAVERTGLRVTT